MPRRTWWFFVLGAAAVAIGFLWFKFTSTPPQLIRDEAVFKTVDALFTAMTTQNPTQLEACAQRLNSYRSEKRLPERAAAKLDEMIKQARSGEWDPAAHRLYDFILGQRGH